MITNDHSPATVPIGENAPSAALRPRGDEPTRRWRQWPHIRSAPLTRGDEPWWCRTHGTEAAPAPRTRG